MRHEYHDITNASEPEVKKLTRFCPHCGERKPMIVYATVLARPYVIFQCSHCDTEYLLNATVDQVKGIADGMEQQGGEGGEDADKLMQQAREAAERNKGDTSGAAERLLQQAREQLKKDAERANGEDKSEGGGKDGKGEGEADLYEYLKKYKPLEQEALKEEVRTEASYGHGYGATGIIFKHPNEGLKGTESKYNPAYDILSPSDLTVFRQKIGLVLRDNAYDRHVGNKRRGKLHDKSLYKLQARSDRIFMQREERQNKEYNVLIVCDLSGSMHGFMDDTAAVTDPDAVRRLKAFPYHNLGEYHGAGRVVPDRVSMALALMYLMVDALKGLKVNVAAFGFNAYHTWIKQWHEELKSEQFLKMLKHCESYGGDNNDELAIYDAMEIMKSAPRQKDGIFRKQNNIVITLSDGGIAGCSSDVSLQGKTAGSLGIKCKEDTMRTMVHKLSQFANVFGVGINSDAVERYYPYNQVVNSGREFVQAVLGFINRNVRIG